MVNLSKEFYSRISKIGLKKRWKKEHSKVRIKKSLSPEKAAIHAYICGDGNIKARKDNRGYPHHDIRIYPDDKNLAFHIVSLFKKEFNIEPKIRDLGKYFRVEIASKPAFLNLLKIGKYDTHSWSIPNNIKKISLKFWLRAFFDSESNVDLNNKVIALKSVNFKGLQNIMKKLLLFGIVSRLYGPYQPKNFKHSSYGILLIRGRNIKVYKRLINFNHPLKREKLAKL
jgi:hypothetical protein